MDLPEIKIENIDFSRFRENYTKINNLNDFKERIFNQPKKRRLNARFRRHPLKI
jgi:hypothetical protein